MEFNTIEEILADLSQGKMVVIVDDEDRENEGDLLMIASHTRPEDINFMVTHGRGLVCLTLMEERCKQLALPLMVSGTDPQESTNFTVSIEASEGVTTGISAQDRAKTVHAAVASHAQANDIVQPGHIFPLMAQPGGVLTRAGHTEAGCDLARLAGAEPAAVIVEILNEDGSMARRPDLERFVQKHQLKMGSIEDLIRYRVQHDRTVERVAETEIKTEFGHFVLKAYQDSAQKETHLALVKGHISADKPALVRVHLENTLCDVLSLNEFSCGWPLHHTMRRIAESENGVLVILRKSTSSDNDMINCLQHITAQKNQSLMTSPHEENETPVDLRTFGIGAQILRDTGVRKMHVLSAPKRFHAIGGFGLEIVDYIQE